MATLKNSRVLRTIPLTLIVALLCPFVHGKAIYVDHDAAGASNGSSWADAYWCLQNALADAQSGDEIWVAKGIYRPDRRFLKGRPPRIVASGDRTATFQLKNGITIKGGYAGFGQPDPDAQDIELYETILSGDLGGDDRPNFTNNSENSYHVVTSSRTNPTAVLDGFIVTGGNANGPLLDSCGGGMYTDDVGYPTVINCYFTGNLAARDGGGFFCIKSSPNIENSTITGNSAYHYGGGIYCDASLQMSNNVIMGNSARYGGAIYCYSSSPIITNCTIVGNLATGYGGGGIYCGNSSPTVVNTILWNNSPDEIYLKSSSISVTHCDVQGGWPGAGNINADPLFVDVANGDYHLQPSSPCIDTGDNSAIPASVAVDLDGNPRIMNDTVDMGAYEAAPIPSVYYVDAVNGDDNNNGLTPQAAFATIQNGIDAAGDGEVVLVYPGLYQEEIDFLGKALIVQGIAASGAGVPVLQNPGDFAVSFYYGEGPDSILKNFIIRDSFMGVFIAGSSPTISNLTIVDNKYGIEAYAGSEPDISNCIFWNNTDGDLFGCEARYSCIERGGEGEGNITFDPLFVDPDSGDYHLRSERGRYWPEYDIWVLDKVNSPCIDGGDPSADYSNEPTPNGGCINMGAYGSTSEASLSLNEQPCSPLGKASNPNPADGAAISVNRNVALNWTPGLSAVFHDVYFGTDGDAVANADTANTTGIYRGRQSATSYTPHETATSYTPPEGVGWSTRPYYYWRIDEVDSKGNKTTGDVWTFITVPPLPKSRACFLGDTSVWVDGTLVQISKVAAGQTAAKVACLATAITQIEKIEEHEGIFTCYEVLLESGNCIGVAECHYFMTESGQWVLLQNLKTGTRLQTSKGSIGIISVTRKPIPYVGKVYNLKIEGADRYLVGEDAVIVRDY